MTKDKFKSLFDVANSNNQFFEHIVSKSSFFANAWVTFLAPVLIGFAVNYFFSLNDKQSIPAFIWMMSFVFLIVHLFVSYVLHQNSRKYSLYSQVVEFEREYHQLRDELAKHKWGLRELSNLHSTQISALRMATHATDAAIGDFDRQTLKAMNDKEFMLDVDFWKMFEQHLSGIMYPLILEREVLFKYDSLSKYNIALYFFDEADDSLKIAYRDCDSRLPQRNRRWRPGIGHVGLAFLHKAVKLCPDITKSSELISDPLSGDAENYRSFLSMPIMRCDDDGSVSNGLKPLGVLVLTSALPNQFDEHRDLPFMTMIVKLLAIYLSSADNYFTRFSYVSSKEADAVIGDSVTESDDENK